jgi:hypothetical protein
MNKRKAAVAVAWIGCIFAINSEARSYESDPEAVSLLLQLSNQHRAKVRDESLAQYAQKKKVTNAPSTVVVEKLVATEEAQVPVVTEQVVTKKESALITVATSEKVEIVSDVAQSDLAPIYKDSSDMAFETESTEPKTWGSFPEASAWMGAWMNPTADTKGAWANLKYLQWYTAYEKPENFGIGANIRWDHGSNSTGYGWGYFAPGPSIGYYRGIGLRNSFQADVSLLYRFDERRDNGFMPTVHVEFSRILDYKNRLTFQIDGSYFPSDSWMGPGLYWEHKLSKDWKVITGAGASLGWTDGDFFSGFQPSLRVKYLNRWNLGINATLFTGLGTFYGVTAAYELTPDMKTWWENKNAAGIKKVSDGSGNNNMPIEVSEKSIKQLIVEEEGK